MDNWNARLRQEIAAVVPCYNSGGRLRPVLQKLCAYIDHIIVVDDGSTDDIAADLEGIAVRLVTFPFNRGKGHALIEGMREARKIDGIQCVVTLDSDGQHNPDEIPRLYKAYCESKADLVIGSRVFDKRDVPLRSRFGNKVTIMLAGLLLGKRLPDTQSGYRLHSAKFVDHILATVAVGRYETEMEILIRGVRDGFVTVPVPIQTIYEKNNKSSHFSSTRDSFLIYRKLLKMTLVGSKQP